VTRYRMYGGIHVAHRGAKPESFSAWPSNTIQNLARASGTFGMPVRGRLGLKTFDNCQRSLLLSGDIETNPGPIRGIIALLFISTILSGDVETNPGPTRVNCGVCTETIRAMSNPITCSGCSTQHHSQCIGTRHQQIACRLPDWRCNPCNGSEYTRPERPTTNPAGTCVACQGGIRENGARYSCPCGAICHKKSDCSRVRGSAPADFPASGQDPGLQLRAFHLSCLQQGQQAT
jgi:hypothetical protein